MADPPQEGLWFGDITLSFLSSAGELSLPGWANVGPYSCPSPNPPSTWLQRQGPEVDDRNGENVSFSKRLGWETSRKEQLLRAEQGRWRGEVGAAHLP